MPDISLQIIEGSFRLISRGVCPEVPVRDHRSEIWFKRSRPALRKSWQESSELLRPLRHIYEEILDGTEEQNLSSGIIIFICDA